jgi:hypothetical protein
MANPKRIVELRPEVADFRTRQSVTMRGDVLSYFPNRRCSSFSTDGAGFRHSVLRGQEYSVVDCLRSERCGLVLGASNVFGSGVAGNENIMASLLAERFGFPFANAAMPGANSRNLHSLLISLVARAGAARAPAVAVVSTGVDLASFCESSRADATFGSPNRDQLKWQESSEGASKADPNESFPRLLAFTVLWTNAIAGLCRGYGIPLVLIHQSTSFEKSKLNAYEKACGLGEPFNPSQERQFENHRKFNQPFYDKRKEIADARKIPLAGWHLKDEISFIDEFHCDRDGIRLVSEAVGNEIEPLLAKKPEGVATGV